MDAGGQFCAGGGVLRWDYVGALAEESCVGGGVLRWPSEGDAARRDEWERRRRSFALLGLVGGLA